MRMHVPASGHDQGTVYTDRQLLNALLRLALGERTLSRKSYIARRCPTDPSPALFERRFGTWNHALERAGLLIIDQPAQLQGTTTKWTDEQLLAALRRCAAETGSSTVRRYQAWQHLHPEAPPAASIRVRLGSWANATSRAFG